MKKKMLLCISVLALVLSLSPVSVSAKTINAKLTLLTKNNETFDYRAEAGEELYNYDTLQGACANKGYGYFTLYNRDVEKCKIVKVRLKDLEVTKVSEPLEIYHANNLTYNTKKNLLVATCCKVKQNRAVFVNPSSLTVSYYKDIKLTKKVKKIPKSLLKNYQGFTAIAYNSSKNAYVGRLRGNNNVILFDKNLKPVKYVVLKGKKTGLMNQGMDSIGKYIYDVRSFKGKYKYSMITVHTWSGKYVKSYKFAYGKEPGQELECMFHDGSKKYVGFYLTTDQINDTKENGVDRNNVLYRVTNM